MDNKEIILNEENSKNDLKNPNQEKPKNDLKKSKQEKTKQEKSKQEKTKQEKTKQEKTKKEKTKKEKTKKTKKEKKILGVPINIDLGKKIKDIEMDSSKYKIVNLLLLIVLNVALIGVLTYFLTLIYNVMILLIVIFTITLCAVWSICTYIMSIIKIKYTIYGHAIVKNFDTSQNIGEFSKLISCKKKTRLIDIIGKKRTSSIILKFSNKWCPKITLSCITEDVDALIEQIKQIAKENPPKPKKEKTLKQKLDQIIDNAPLQSNLAKEIGKEKNNDKDKNSNKDKE